MSKKVFHNAAAIDEKRLKQLVTAIRRTTALSTKERLQMVEDVLRVADIISRTDVEQLVCVRHAKELKGYAFHSSVYWLAEKGKIRPYKICCREFLSRSELESLPDAGLPAHLIPRKPVIKVKVKG
jgi:hypothetical protein